MRILVTGGLGFIGSNFCRNILATNPEHRIVNVDKMGLGANPANLKDLKRDLRYRFIKGDIRNPSLIARLIKDSEAIVNFAAETHVDRSIKDPVDFLENNTVGTFTILEAIRKQKTDLRLVQVSTDEIYGDILRGSSTEQDPPRPSNPYSAAKASADMFVLAYARTYGIDASITRCTNNFGPFQYPEKLIPKTIIRALANLQIPIYGTGQQKRDWLYVQDHCNAINLVLDKGEPREIYNISSGKEQTNLETVKEILLLLGKKENLISFVEDRPGHDVRYSLDSSKIRNKLGWKPRHSFKDALEATVDWYKENHRIWKPFVTRNVLDPAPWKVK